MEKQILLQELRQILKNDPEFKNEIIETIDSITSKDINRDIDEWVKKSK